MSSVRHDQAIARSIPGSIKEPRQPNKPKTQQMKRLIGLIPILLFGCDPMTTHPMIYVDTAFTPAEVSPILYGTYSWDRNTNSGIHPSFEYVDHAVIYDMAKSNSKTNAVYLIRSSAIDKQACPPNRPARKNELATTYRGSAKGSAITCYDADAINASPPNPHFEKLGVWAIWAIAAAHEFGHAIKQGHHSSPNAIMYPSSWSVSSYDITCVDVKNAADTWDFEVPKECM